MLAAGTQCALVLKTQACPKTSRIFHSTVPSPWTAVLPDGPVNSGVADATIGEQKSLSHEVKECEAPVSMTMGELNSGWLM